jgi:hypothetical protein
MPVRMKNGIYDFTIQPNNEWKNKGFKFKEKPELEFGHEFNYFIKREVE